MEFFDVVARRRSVRDYTDEVVPDDVIQKAFDAAILAPNSSNTQTWNFYWVKSPGPKKRTSTPGTFAISSTFDSACSSSI